MTNIKEKLKANPKGIYGKYLLAKMNKGHLKNFEYGLSFIDLKPYDHVLDIGCGGGFFTNKLASMLPNGHVIGIDVSRMCIKQALHLNKEYVKSNICEFRQENVLDLSVKENSIDVALALCTVRFWSDLPVAFGHINRILNNHGVFIISDYGRYDIDMVEMDLYMAGFKKVTVNKSEDGLVVIIAKK